MFPRAGLHAKKQDHPARTRSGTKKPRCFFNCGKIHQGTTPAEVLVTPEAPRGAQRRIRHHAKRELQGTSGHASRLFAPAQSSSPRFREPDVPLLGGGEGQVQPHHSKRGHEHRLMYRRRVLSLPQIRCPESNSHVRHNCRCHHGLATTWSHVKKPSQLTKGGQPQATGLVVHAATAARRQQPGHHHEAEVQSHALVNPVARAKLPGLALQEALPLPGCGASTEGHHDAAAQQGKEDSVIQSGGTLRNH
mmetsp:Transcript_21150/g.47668  ORF Transcript_21150/g.47668 Transcript_21150/m.47668 type:complete len:249 (-) Transcript_21150:174-920(-)